MSRFGPDMFDAEQDERDRSSLEQHISDLEMSLESVRKERDEALLSAKHGWDRHAEKDRAYGEALADRDRHAQSAETWRKRVEQAADALSDVLPGGVGWMDLPARISALKGQMLTTQIERDEARTELARLKPSGQVADADLWCDACAGIRPHRRKPSPDAGPFWRCSECGSPFRPNSDPGDTDAAVEMLRKLATKAAAMGDAPPSGNRPSRQVAEDETRLRHTLNARGAAPQTHDALSRLAAKAHAHDAAVADNAEMVEFCRTERQMLALLYHRIKALGVHDATVATTDAVTTVEHWMDAVPDTYEQPHPGTALLEQHSKALVRARNEGLEKAAGFMENWPEAPSAPSGIRSMKEPEQ